MQEDPYSKFLALNEGDKAVQYGLPGESTVTMVSRVEAVLAQFERISIFIALGGTNDIVRGPGASKIVANMQAVAQKALAKSDVVLLLTVPFFPNLVRLFPAGVDTVKRVNEGLLATKIDRVRVVDLCAHMSAEDDSLWDRDGLHPNVMGYKKFAEVIQSAQPDLFRKDQ